MGGSGLTGLDIGQMMSATDFPLVEGGHGRRILDYRTRSVRCALPVPQAEERRHEVARLVRSRPNEPLRYDAAHMCRNGRVRQPRGLPAAAHSNDSGQATYLLALVCNQIQADSLWIPYHTEATEASNISGRQNNFST